MSHDHQAFSTFHARLTTAFGVPLSTIIPMGAMLFGMNVGAVVVLQLCGVIADDVQQLDPLVLIAAAAIMLGSNLFAYSLMVAICRRVIQPWRRMNQLIHHGRQLMSEERGEFSVSILNLRDMAGELATFAHYAEDAHRKYNAVQGELAESRRLMAEVVSKQQMILDSTNREIIEQYRCVLAYANYLDEQVDRPRDAMQLRYDFDDVCESSFNLKLIAQSLDLLRSHDVRREPVQLSRLLQQTLVSLTSALDRRSMQLSTLGVDETTMALADSWAVSHALWMIMLGTIRYAAQESTLQLRCHLSPDGAQAIIRMVVSELEPGQLTPQERQAHFTRQNMHASPHMFAETIRHHANLQLAEWVLACVQGTVTVLPITSYACEISLILPAAK